MSNSMRNDYFSFMSDRWETKQSKRPPLTPVPSLRPNMVADTIDFVEEEPQIEVVESFVSDTTIQRMFKRSAAG
jgi:hypothetical protein